MSSNSKEVTAYLDELTPTRLKEFERIKNIVEKLVPDAGVKPSYGILAFTRNGKWVLYFGAFKNHLSLYPPTLKYTETEPVSEAEVARRVKKRIEQLDA